MPDSDITQLLIDLETGHDGALDRLLVKVYPELRQMARGKLRRQQYGQTLSPTGLVHEAYLKLVRYQDVSWHGRAHFFGAASGAMRRILVDRARAKATEKRRGERVTLSHAGPAVDVSLDELLDLDEALIRLAEQRPRWVNVVECRYFGGLTLEETAEALGISHATVSNDWRMARAWLQRELH